MSNIQHMPSLHDVIARFELHARKSLGQHFLLDMNLTRKIAAAAGDVSSCSVFEIGPGPGGLTRALVDLDAARIIAVEKDPRFIDALQDLVAASDGKLKVIQGDALKIDLCSMAPAPRAIVANLPYNVGTELLLCWLREINFYRSLTLMFQAEVVDRLCAAPGSKAYGRLSVITQFCCNIKRIMEIPASAFTPPPKVDSAVVHLTPRADRPADLDFADIEKVTSFAFGMRRKMLRSSLKKLGGEALLKEADIDPTLRAENLSLTNFKTLARIAKRP